MNNDSEKQLGLRKKETKNNTQSLRRAPTFQHKIAIFSI